MVKNLPSNAGAIGMMSSWVTEIPHAMGQLNPSAITRGKPARSNIKDPL